MEKFESLIKGVVLEVLTEGLFEAPPVTLREVNDWVTSVYAGHIWHVQERRVAKLTSSPTEQLDKAIAILDVWKAKALSNGEGLGWDKSITAKVPLSNGKDYKVGLKKTDDRWYVARGVKRLSYDLNYASFNWDTTQSDIEQTHRVAVGAVESSWYRVPEPTGSPNRAIADAVIIIEECKKYALKPKHYKSKASKRFETSLSGWKYMKPDWEAKPKNRHYSEIVVDLYLKSDAVNSKGWWMPGKGKIVIHSPGGDSRVTTVKRFRSNLNDILETTRHELQHWAQDELGALTNAPAGGPAKAQQGYGHDSEHAMRDEEFQTRLADEVSRFNALLPKLARPGITKAEFAKAYVGASKSDMRRSALGTDALDLISVPHFFKTLKLNQPQKWRDAIRTFMGEVL